MYERHMLGRAGVAIALALAGCATETVVVREPVTVVPTRTPGVAFVIVRPAAGPGSSLPERRQPGDDDEVNPSSDYILLCDARPVEGMYCGMPSEAALRRFSYTATPGKAAAPVGDAIGTLDQNGIGVSGAGLGQGTSTAPPPLPAPAAVPPPPSAPLPPPPPLPPAPPAVPGGVR